MRTKKVLIVGGGFGGVEAALELCKHEKYRVSLLSNKISFQYYPALYHTATGGVKRISDITLAEIFKHKSVELIHGEAEKLDRTHKVITTASGDKISYDIVILSLGAVTNYFGIRGMQEYSYGIKSLQEAEELKKHLHDQLINERQPDLNYIIVGGGPTGIELAGTLPDYMKRIMKQHGLRNRKLHIDLVEAAPHLMPRMPKSVSRSIERQLRKVGVKLYLGTPVQAETANTLLMNGKYVRSHTVVWTAGIANNPFFNDNNFILAKNHKVQVDKLLQAWPGVFVIGDNADTPYSGMAQTALYDAKYVANNLIRHSNGEKPYAYKPKKPFYVTPAGHHWASVVWGPLHLYGWLGWIIRGAADWIGYHDIEPWWRATERFIATTERDDLCDICAASDIK